MNEKEIKNSETDNDLNDEPIIYETSGANSEDIDLIQNESNKIINNNELKPNLENPLFPNLPQSGVHIDPNDFMTIKSHKIKSSFPDVITELDSEDDSMVSDDEQRKLVSEAFADDDVINDFKKEKLEKCENEDEKSVSLHLPGWGSWAGDGIKQSKRKIRQFTVKGRKRLRKDAKIRNVIITEKKDETIAKFQVCLYHFF